MYSVLDFLGFWGFGKCFRDLFSPEKINFDFTSPAKFFKNLPDLKNFADFGSIPKSSF